MSSYDQRATNEFVLALAVLVTAGMVEPDLHVRCKGCTYSRHFGNAPFTAKVKMSSHGLRKRHHLVMLDHGIQVEEFIPSRDTQTFDDVPPF